MLYFLASFAHIYVESSSSVIYSQRGAEKITQRGASQFVLLLIGPLANASLKYWTSFV
jgi:hypothetical protein